MTIGFLTASASRRAGGLFEAVRRLAQESARLSRMTVRAVALEDNDTNAVRSAWQGVPLMTARVLGPRSFGFAPRLVRYLLEGDIDLVHQHGLWMYPSIACERWSAATGRPYVVSPHGMLDPWALQNSRWKKCTAGRLYEDAHFRGAACFHALCEAEVRAIRAYGLTNPVCVLPNGVDLPRKPVLREHREPRTLLYLGRLHPKKNLSNLLRAWTEVRREAALKRWRLVIAGWDQGGHETQLRREVEGLGLEDTVAFDAAKYGDQKDATLRMADAFILPSYSEGLPMTVLEAWAYNLPVLMTPECNLPEGFQAGAALEIGTKPERIAVGLIDLFRMREEDRQSIGERARSLVAEKFSWSSIARDMKRVYEWILGGGNAPDPIRFV